MGCFDTGKLSDSETKKRLRNGSFAENARWLAFARVQYALERSAPDDLPGVACGVLKPSAEQQGVQEQRQDGVLGGPRCRKDVICISCMHHPLARMLNRRVFHKMLPY